jgi:hypothetical protein
LVGIAIAGISTVGNHARDWVDNLTANSTFTLGESTGISAEMPSFDFVWDSPDIRAAFGASEPVVLGEGTYTAGVDMPAGRYTIHAADPEAFGWLRIASPAADDYGLSVMIAGESISEGGPTSFTATVAEDMIVEVYAGNDLNFTPAPTHLAADVLTQGIWLVGADIDEGVYRVTATGARTGAVTVTADGLVSLGGDSEFLDPTGGSAPTDWVTEWHTGDVVTVEGLDRVAIASELAD